MITCVHNLPQGIWRNRQAMFRQAAQRAAHSPHTPLETLQEVEEELENGLPAVGPSAEGISSEVSVEGGELLYGSGSRGNLHIFEGTCLQRRLRLSS